MRAISGAVITAGAFIALGLCAVGIGTRYAHATGMPSGDTQVNTKLLFRDLDNGLMFCTVMSALGVGIGLGITFLGLAYHHYRRHHEHLRYMQGYGGTTHTGVPSTHSGMS